MDEASLTSEEQLQAEQYAALFLQMAQREAHRFGKLIPVDRTTNSSGRPNSTFEDSSTNSEPRFSPPL